MAYTRHASKNCYPGMGAVHIGQSRVQPDDNGQLTPTAAAVHECFERCNKFTEGGVPCTAVTILMRPKRKREKKGANCFYRSQATPGLCGSDPRFDTFVRVEK